MAAAPRVLVLFLSIVASVGFSDAELVLVYSIQRHGARNVLPKSSTLKESEATGGPTLLPQGQRQCYAAGAAFRTRYLDSSTCAASTTCLPPAGSGADYGVAGQPGVGFSNYNTFSNSSALDRTILSAAAFLAGAFPATANASASTYLPTRQQLVPVFSVSDAEDWKVRGYTKCPAYAARLEAWLRSPEFRAREAASAGLRDAVLQLAPPLNVSLSNWWNVYDAFAVWRGYQVGDPQPPVDEATFEQIVDLAMWLETSKMAPSLAGNLLGGAMLGDLLFRLAAAELAVRGGSQAYYRLLTVSSHYNTQLGLIAALFSDQPSQPDHPWRSKIPALASILAFELHAAPPPTPGAPPSLFAVRAVIQDGPGANYTALPLPCAAAGDAAESLVGPGACTLGAFRGLAGPRALNGSAAWCDACANTQVLACRVADMERQLTAVADGGGGGGGAGGVSPGMVAVWCAVSVAAAALLAAGGFAAARALRQRRRRAGTPGGGASVGAGVTSFDL